MNNNIYEFYSCTGTGKSTVFIPFYTALYENKNSEPSSLEDFDNLMKPGNWGIYDVDNEGKKVD